MKYKNPFQSQPCDPAEFDTGNKRLTKSKCGRGFIVKPHEHRFDYVVNGVMVTCRAGKSMAVLEDLIAVCLDGKKPGPYHEHRALNAYANTIQGVA